MAETDKRYGASAFILFLIFPFLGFIRACGRLRAPLCGIVFVLFYALFGYCHTFEDSRMDAYRIAYEFVHSYVPTWSMALHQYESGIQPDLFKVGLFWLVGKYTHSPHVYFAAVGLLGSIFACLTLQRLLKDYTGRHNYAYYIVVVLLLLCFSPVNIGGVRFFTGMGIASYATLKVILDRKWLWMSAFLVIPFIHFSMIAWVPVILFAMFIKLPKTLLFYTALICCVFGTTLNGTSYQESISKVVMQVGVENEAVKTKTAYYTSKTAAKYFEKSLTTHISRAVSYVNAVWFVLSIIALKRRFLRTPLDKYSDHIWRTALLFSSFGYLMSGLSTVGGRYQLLGTLLLLLLFICMLSSRTLPLRRLATKIIVCKLMISSVSLAMIAYNCYHLTTLELYYAPMPFVLTSI